MKAISVSIALVIGFYAWVGMKGDLHPTWVIEQKGAKVVVPDMPDTYAGRNASREAWYERHAR